MNYTDEVQTEFSSFLEHLPIAVFVVDEKGNILFYNQNWLDATGYRADEIQNMKVWEIFGGGSTALINETMEKVFAGDKTDDIICPLYQHLTHKKTYYKLSGKLYQGKHALFSLIDISEEMALQKTLMEKKKQFFSIINSLGDVVFKLDRQGNYKNIWTPDVSKLFDEKIDFTGRSIKDHFREDLVQLFLETIENAIYTNHMVNMEFSNLHQGKEKWFLAKIAPIHIKDATRVEEVTVIIRDITQERKNKHQIEYKNRLINQLTSIKNGPILHVIEGNNLTFKFISGNLNFLTGYTPHEIEDINWWEIIYENDKEYVEINVQKLTQNGNKTSSDLIYRIVNKEGHINWITNHLSKSEVDGQDIIFGLMLNVTEIQYLNHQLKQRDRILTNSGRVAMIGGWEYDVKYNQTHLTDELYDIYEVDKQIFNLFDSIKYFVGDHAEHLRKHMNDLLNKGKGFDLELKLLTGKGNVKWVRVVGCAEFHLDKITFIYGIIQDINEKKEKDLILQESERRFNAAFELAPIGIGLVSPEGAWIKVNIALAKFFEFSEEEMQMVSLGHLKLHEDWKMALKLAADNRNSELNIYQLEKEFLNRSGETKWGKLNVNSVKDREGKPLYFIFQIVDITGSKEFERKLVEAKKEAEEATKAKSDFLSTMSHEIRTPLYGVIGMTDLLYEEIKDPHLLEQLKALKFSSDSLLLIVNDILDYSKIKSGALTLELKPFWLKQLVETVRDSNLQKAHAHENKINIHFEYDLPAKIMGDKLRIGQVLNNLVDNAIKFTKKGIIDITVKNKSKEDDLYILEFSVKDNGIGIPKEMQSAIFEQFIQAESGTTRKYGGTGLGLSIVKGLLKRMNSEVKLTSQPGHGTEITFDLPLQAVNEKNALVVKEPSEKLKDLEQKTILLVEDNPISIMVASDYIKKWNGNVILAENGMVAIEKFMENKDRIALVLMDLQMPVMNGFEATEKINKINPEISVIALTASIGDKSRLESADYGMAAYIIKPYDPTDFYLTIKKYIK
jgi:PAS domain S-box-containing protein